ncbi:hypothetical protein ACH5RR_015503 [Cinchona calisaya]|uniref:FRIGIDA-like protein n=1 Tax=Cinchona calisaya TaxID=153742 RepID=A0ABD2ZTD3_9GENT
MGCCLVCFGGGEKIKDMEDKEEDGVCCGGLNGGSEGGSGGGKLAVVLVVWVVEFQMPLIPVLVDLVLGKKRMLVTSSIKLKAEEIVEIWKKSSKERDGTKNVKTLDVYTSLQHLVTFAIVKEKDLELYRKLVVASSWRK